MPKITTFLWFNQNAEEAVDFYLAIFSNSKKGIVTRYGAAGPGPKGSVMTIQFFLNGQEFAALNGGPHYTFNPAISLVVHCDTQQEIDQYWAKLTEGGKAIQCGWLTDQYGVSWQIVPALLPTLLKQDDQAKADRVMQAIMPMIKLDIEKLKQAAGQS
jgi:predicted 3-demethylubiquinone-9 3-methyltransferase (glyoxalase superfamily)